MSKVNEDNLIKSTMPDRQARLKTVNLNGTGLKGSISFLVDRVINHLVAALEYLSRLLKQPYLLGQYVSLLETENLVLSPGFTIPSLACPTTLFPSP